MSRESYRDGMKKWDLSGISLFRLFLVFFVPFTAFSLSVFFPLSLFFLVFPFFNLSSPLHWLLLSFFILGDFFFFIVCHTIIPGVFLKLLRVRCDEGVYDVSVKDKNFFMMALHTGLYRPPLKLLGVFKLLPLRLILHRLAGLKIGSSSLIPGTETFFDPYLTEIGEQTLIGGSVKITCHSIEEKVELRPVKIGDDCIIGSEVFIFPGAVVEDNVTIGARSLVLKDQRLKKNRVYAGVPAREVKKKKSE
ncbi:MAG: hypothetical protein V5A68_03105 [Candidatus Thermoplasmatota archaeon]